MFDFNKAMRENSEGARSMFVGIGSTPDKDWFIIFVFFVLLNLASLALCGYLYLKVTRGELFSVVESRAPIVKKIDKTALKNTIDSYSKKKLDHDLLLVSKPMWIDPSR